MHATTTGRIVPLFFLIHSFPARAQNPHFGPLQLSAREASHLLRSRRYPERKTLEQL
jgi:hypothetical protein